MFKEPVMNVVDVKVKLLTPPGFTATLVTGKLTWNRSKWENMAFSDDGWESVLPVSLPWYPSVYLNLLQALATLQQSVLSAGSQIFCECVWDNWSCHCPVCSLGSSGHLCQWFSKWTYLHFERHAQISGTRKSLEEIKSWIAPKSVFAAPKTLCLKVRGQIDWLFPRDLLKRRGAVPWIRRSCTALYCCQEGEGVI